MAIQYFVTFDSTDHPEKVFILTDCQAAIDSVVNRREADGGFQVLARIRHHLISLRNLKVSVVLVSIPGHADIYYNDLADRAAKQAVIDATDLRPILRIISLSCKKLISKQCQSQGLKKPKFLKKVFRFFRFYRLFKRLTLL